MTTRGWPGHAIDAAVRQIIDEEDRMIIKTITNIVNSNKYLSRIHKMNCCIEKIKENI